MLNDFQISDNLSNTLEFDDVLVKENDLRANISLKVAATAIMGLTSISGHVSAGTFNFNVPKNLTEETVSLVNNIDEYTTCTNILIKNNFLSLDKSKIIEDVISFKSLENSWDGHRAIPLVVKCAVNAIKLIEMLDNYSLIKVSDYYPNAHGTISFELENDFNEIIVLEVGKETFSYYVSLNNVETQYYNKQDFNFENIEILKKFISSI